MKTKFLFVSIFLCLALFAQAAQQIVVNTTAGNLKKDLGAIVGFDPAWGAGNRLNPVSDLKINGTLNAQDFSDIQASLNWILTTLDMSGLTAIEASGDGGTPAGEIPENAFYQYAALTTVTLPTNAKITSIANQAFTNCTALTSINIPEGITHLGDYALSGSALTSITLPSTATNWEGEGVFARCSQLTQVNLPDGLTAIPNSTFLSANLSTISIPSTVSVIGNQVFNKNKNLKEVILPDGLKELGGFRTFANTAISKLVIPNGTLVRDGDMYETFNGCESLVSVNIPSNAKTIRSNVFSWTAIKTIDIPQGVKSILTSFANCPNLESIEIPESMEVLGQYAFGNCAALKSVTFKGTKLNTIGAGVFYGCSALTSLEIPQGVTSIGEDAFNGCSGLTLLKVNNPVPVIFTSQTTVFAGIGKTTCKLQVPFGSKKDYSELDLWKDFTNIEEFTLSGIDNATGSSSSLGIERNPVIGDEAKFTFGTAAAGAVLNISNLSGKLLVKQAIAAGSTTAIVSVAGFSNGVYLVLYSDNSGKRAVLKMIK